MKKSLGLFAELRLVTVAMTSLILTLVLAPEPARAYDPDTHYQVTYVLCRAAGLNHADALIVAQCDEGLDDSAGTIANHGIQPNIREEGKWHSLPARANPQLVLDRKIHLFRTAVDMPDRKRKLQYLGVFFHYQQDTWAHRVHPNSHPTKFTPYVQPLGHGLMGHQPDRPPFDPICALRCLEEGIDFARRFIQATGGTVNPMFNNYTPANGELDGTWSGKGKFINQIVIDKSNRAHEFTTSLIRTQIDSYTNGLEAPVVGNPNYQGYYTSNEADYTTVRLRFKEVCARFGIPEAIPEFFVPLSTLTTDMIVAGAELPTPGPAMLIKLKSADNGAFVCASDGLADNQWLYCKSGMPVEFWVVGPLSNCVLKVKDRDLYFSFNETTGAVKLWATPDKANFRFEKQGNGTYAIRNLAFDQYVWLDGESPYVTGSGTPGSRNAQWNISGLEPKPSPGPDAKIVKLRSVSSGRFIVASDGLTHNQWLYAKDGTPVPFLIVGPLNNCVLKVVGEDLYFSYNETTGAVKLWNTSDAAKFSFERQANGNYAIKNIEYDQYLWLDGVSPYITGSGKPGNENAQWSISGLSAPPTPPPGKKTIKIKSATNGQFVVASDGLAHNEWLYCKSGAALEFEVVGPLSDCVLKVKGKNLYFSYNETTGAVKLWNTRDGANFKFEKQSNGNYAIKNLKYLQYVWLDGESPYITGSGKPGNRDAQWVISGL